MILILLFSASLVSAAGPFTDNGNGTMTDTGTGLVWPKNGFCLGYMNWDAAANAAKTLATGACGLSDGSLAGDWHLPTIDELKSLICGPGVPVWGYDGCGGSNTWNPNGGQPYEWLESQGFTNVMRGNAWSSSTYPAGPDSAWYVDMFYGYISGEAKNFLYGVWSVRGGQPVRADGPPQLFYTTLQGAFDDVDGGVVRAWGVTFTESLSLNRPVAVKLLGGYNIDWSGPTGVTTIDGDLTIDTGSLVVDRVAIR
jgi:hypothetical protein